MVLGLYDPLEVVVETGKGRRCTGEPDDATLRKASLLHVVVGSGAFSVEPPGRSVVASTKARESLRPGLSGRLRHRRHLAVLRIDDDRSSELAVDAECIRATIDPEGVVIILSYLTLLVDLVYENKNPFIFMRSFCCL